MVELDFEPEHVLGARPADPVTVPVDLVEKVKAMATPAPALHGVTA
jgi:hypothetical protein